MQVEANDDDDDDDDNGWFGRQERGRSLDGRGAGEGEESAGLVQHLGTLRSLPLGGSLYSSTAFPGVQFSFGHFSFLLA